VKGAPDRLGGRVPGVWVWKPTGVAGTDGAARDARSVRQATGEGGGGGALPPGPEARERVLICEMGVLMQAWSYVGQNTGSSADELTRGLRCQVVCSGWANKTAPDGLAPPARPLLSAPGRAFGVALV